MPAHVIYGDSFLVAERLRQVKVEAGAADLMDSNRHVVSAGQARPAEVLAMCNSLPFLDTMRLVEIEGVLATQQGSVGGRRSGRRSASASSAWTQLVDAVPTLPDTTVLIFVDGDLQQGNPFASGPCPIIALCTGRPLPTPKRCCNGSSNGPRTRVPASPLRGCRCWPSWWAAICGLSTVKLEKLSLYATGRSVTDADVRAMVPYAQEANIFAAVDSIMDGRPGAALRSVVQLMDDGQEPLYIIAMIERQLRLIALAREPDGSRCRSARPRSAHGGQFRLRGPQDLGSGAPDDFDPDTQQIPPGAGEWTSPSSRGALNRLFRCNC